ncbi:MAG: MFS transporter [Clostridia bacterium]
MATILLIIIYLAFISLGLPDSLLGAAWPAVHLDLDATISAAGIVAMVVTAGTVISSLLSAKLIKRFGTDKVTAACVLLTAVALLTISYVHSFWLLCLLSLPLGLGGGSIDAALNHFVATHYRAAHMNFLHGFWGVGATLGPLIMAAYLGYDGNWHDGYRCIGLIQVTLAAVMLLTLPLWKKVEREQADEMEKAPMVADNRAALGADGAKVAMLAFFFYCAAEMTMGLWATTYFTVVQRIPVDVAARYGSLFFMGIMAGRFVCGFIALKVRETALIRIGVLLAALGVISLIAPLPQPLQLCGLLLTGLGLAPIFPNLIRLTPARFSGGLSQAVMGLEMAAAYVGSTVMPPLIGLVGQRFGFSSMPWCMLFYVTMVLLLTEANNHHFLQIKLLGKVE